MLQRENVEHCDRCEELTPHRHRTISFLKLLCFWLLVQAAVVFWAGGSLTNALIGGVVVVIVLLIRNRSKLWRVKCDRCRWKIQRERNRYKPTLDGNTEITFMITVT
ncbi:MAG: hypothetical protein ACI8TQ_003431 [Planctomycetota bacterium]|jgi:hypothetical protein